MIKNYGEKFFKALELVNSRRVRKIVFVPSKIERWIVIGVQANYLIIPRTYCQCDDFYLSVVIRGSSDACYHLIAQTIAEALNMYEQQTLSDGHYMEFMREFHEITGE